MDWKLDTAIIDITITFKVNAIILHSSKFTQKTSTCELCPSPLCPSVYQKQLATGQKLGLHPPLPYVISLLSLVNIMLF